MYYIDTSVLVAYYCPEPFSEKAESFLTAHPQLAISYLTELELFSAVSRKIREGGMTPEDGNRVTAKFLSHLDNYFYTILPVESHHYKLARDWIGHFSTPLRSLDSIHLAIASQETATIVTADKGLAKSAELLAVDVCFLNRDLALGK